jgi:predicted alpha/beta superfamily hydrolase
MKLLLPCFAALSVVAASANPVVVEGLQSLDDTHHQLVSSESLGKQYQVFVKLPPSYESESQRSYPTVYILDGGELYPLFASYSGYLTAGQEIPELILVAISYGTGDWRHGNDRGHDYTAPTDEREHWGGAAEFQAFLDGELIPLVEKAYRSDAGRRIIFGQSLGGQFVLFTAQTRPELFWGHIASNPALHRNLPFFLETNPGPQDIESRLFVASGSHDDPQYRTPALVWIDHWTNRDDKPWRLEARTLDGHSHFSAPPASFRDGLRWLFSD